MKYDDIDWHEIFELNLNNEEILGKHIGHFLEWAFKKGLAGMYHLDEEEHEVKAVIEGTMSGMDFLLTHCDGKLTDEEFNLKGNLFAQKYYNYYLELYETMTLDRVYAMLDEKFYEE